MKLASLISSLFLYSSVAFSQNEPTLVKLVIQCQSTVKQDQFFKYRLALCVYDNCKSKKYEKEPDCKDAVNRVDSVVPKEQMQQLRELLK